MQGKTSNGGNMPPYSFKYRRGNVSYRSYKMRVNPLNRGYWDLKHWWNNQYYFKLYNSIKVTVTQKEVRFNLTYDPVYMAKLYKRVPKSEIIGITKDQFFNVQLRNKNKIKPKILDIINNGK